MIKKVIIASQSPVKINAVKTAFKKVFPNISLVFDSINAPSGVADQPMNNAETFAGAINRVNYSFKEQVNADFWVGIEGGIQNTENEFEAFAWIYKVKK